MPAEIGRLLPSIDWHRVSLRRLRVEVCPTSAEVGPTLARVPSNFAGLGTHSAQIVQKSAGTRPFFQHDKHVSVSHACNAGGPQRHRVDSHAECALCGRARRGAGNQRTWPLFERNSTESGQCRPSIGSAQTHGAFFGPRLVPNTVRFASNCVGFETNPCRICVGLVFTSSRIHA